jgi:prepilin-type N-terminal cleavage/methylation domain-containing protein
LRKTGEQGFTLIELSMVLVIIGLIIGGVLVGQNLISAGAARAQITQVERYNTAVNTFRNKYNGLPGDMSVATAAQSGFAIGAGCNGGQGARDGNGLLDGAPSPDLYTQGMGETGLFWSDLSTANLIEGSYPGGANCSGVPSIISGTALNGYFPAAKIGGGNYVYVYELNGYNWFGVSAITSIITGADNYGLVDSNATMTVSQAFSIDTKIDDGLPLTGHVQANRLCCTSNTIVNSTNIRDTEDIPSDTPTTCGVNNYNNGPVPQYASHYSMNQNNGAGQNCALSFQFQ